MAAGGGAGPKGAPLASEGMSVLELGAAIVAIVADETWTSREGAPNLVSRACVMSLPVCVVILVNRLVLSMRLSESRGCVLAREGAAS